MDNPAALDGFRLSMEDINNPFKDFKSMYCRDWVGYIILVSKYTVNVPGGSQEVRNDQVSKFA